MTAKKPDADTPPSEEEADMKKIEEKIKRMLDPSVSDAPEKPADDKENEPSTAPEFKEPTEGIALPTEIKIMSADEKVETPETNKSKSIPIKIDASDSETDNVVVREESKEAEVTKTDESEPDAEAPDLTAIDPLDEAQETAVVGAGDAETDDASGTEEAAETSETEAESKLDEEENEDAEPIPSPVIDHETDKAVDDIIASDSDELLEAEDEKRQTITKQPKVSLLTRVKRLPAIWWHNRLARRATLAFLFVGLLITLTVPPSRYFLLNTFGVRSGASIKILDDSTQQPLRNVRVSLRGQSELTDNEGVARFNKLKLGRTELVVERRAFAPVKRNVTLGWGSNPLGDASLTPVGIQYSFIVTDFLSSKPLSKVEAVSDEASAYSDEKGQLRLTVDKTDDSPFEIKLVKEGLRTELFTIDPNDTSERAVQMAPGRKHVFISKRSGKFDVYKIDADGKNEEVIVAGSGHERSDMVLVPHPQKEFVALVSTRTGARNGQGFLMSTLLLIDLSDNSTVEVALSERIQVLGWLGDKLMYVRIVAGSSAANPSRHRLMTYDLESFESQELASSNYFNDLLIAHNRVYYAPSSAYQSEAVALWAVKGDGKERQKIKDEETWSLFRTGYQILTLAIGQDWFEYNLGSGQVTELGGEPANLRDRAYTDSPDGKKSVWLDVRDGKGVLLAYDIEANKDTQVLELSGIKTPVRWLNNTSLVYRVSTAQETADFALSLDGGEPKKIRDVTDTAGVDSWYYY
jgi:hypothetical protein